MLISNDIAVETLRHSYDTEPPETDDYGRCVHCGYDGEFMHAPHAHYSSCEWMESDFGHPDIESSGDICECCKGDSNGERFCRDCHEKINRLLNMHGKTPKQIAGHRKELVQIIKHEFNPDRALLDLLTKGFSLSIY